MPVEFLSEGHKKSYGRFCGDPTEAQLATYFHLDDSDRTLINSCRQDHNRLGFALQLTTVRFLGTFLAKPTDIPDLVIHFIAKQIGIKETRSLSKYVKRKQTHHAHANEIRMRYGYKDFTKGDSRFRLIRILYTRSWLNNERPSLMFDLAVAWLTKNKILLPGITTLSRLVSEIRDRSTNRLLKKLYSLPSKRQRTKLETLLDLQKGTYCSHFDQCRQGPVKVSSFSFNAAIERYEKLHSFGVRALDFSSIPPVRLKSLARYATLASVHKIARMPERKRIAILVAFVQTFEMIALDDALDVLNLLVTDITREAKKVREKKRLRTLKDLDKAALLLAEACVALLEESNSSNDLREIIFSKIPRESISQSIDTINDLARESDEDFHEELIEQHRKVRRFLPHLLRSIEFKSSPAGFAIIRAFNYLKSLEGTHRKTLKDAPLDIIPQSWQKLVITKKGLVDRKAYTLCVLEKLQDKLKRRDVYVEFSDRWGDTRKKLLSKKDWDNHKHQICRSLGHPLKVDEAVQSLSKQLSTAYTITAGNFDLNEKVRVEYKGKLPTLTITNLEAAPLSGDLENLRSQVESVLPRIDLPELILEIDAQTGFTNEFTHVSESNARASDLNVSICAALLAEACNVGIEPFIQQSNPALTRHRLIWVQQNYIREETLRHANAKLVDYQSKITLANTWGGGEVASADGLRFVTPVASINSGPNRKYFGARRGITWYNFISDQYSCFHGIVIPGTLRDSVFVLEGLLEQQTGLNPPEIMTDTAGVSDMIFGLFWLLGYQFSPRLADAGESVFWRIDMNENYGALNEIARGRIKTDRIKRHWDDMLRVAASLKSGTVRASELVRSLLKSDRPSGLAQGIIEVGRINKTIYLLNYIDNEEYRRHILKQLNRGEGRHVIARMICHGRRGEIYRKYREGQEDQLGALGIVTNAVILWNTIYIDSVLSHMKKNGGKLKEKDVACLSPLQHKHINVLGNYSFNLDEDVVKGNLRPLNIADRKGACLP
ncbi:MAG: Tn3 family transposase [Chlamydiota bacterium]